MKVDYKDLLTGYFWYRRLPDGRPPGEWQICTIRHEDQFVDFFGEHSQPFFFPNGTENRYLNTWVEFGPPVDKPGNLPE